MKQLVRWISLAVMTFLLEGCKHPTDDMSFIGVENIAVPPGFYVVNNSLLPDFKQVDLSVNKQNFQSQFSGRVSWTILIQGDLSGAKKEISGTGVALGVSASSWSGDSDNGINFQDGENCQVWLTFSGSSLSLHTEFFLLRSSSKNSMLADDFESSGHELLRLDSIYSDAADVGVKTLLQDSALVFQGKYSLHMEGTDQSMDYWITGIHSKNKKMNNGLGGVAADSMMISFYVYGSGQENSGLQVLVREDDNHSGQFESAYDDSFSQSITIDWTGWKKVVFPYGSFIRSAGTGNKLGDPGNIIGLSFVLFSTSTGGKASVNIDYVLLAKSR